MLLLRLMGFLRARAGIRLFQIEFFQLALKILDAEIGSVTLGLAEMKVDEKCRHRRHNPGHETEKKDRQAVACRGGIRVSDSESAVKDLRNGNGTQSITGWARHRFEGRVYGWEGRKGPESASLRNRPRTTIPRRVFPTQLHIKA